MPDATSFEGGCRCLSLFGWGVAISDAKSGKKAYGVGERGLSLQCQKQQIPKGASKMSLIINKYKQLKKHYKYDNK